MIISFLLYVACLAAPEPPAPQPGTSEKVSLTEPDAFSQFDVLKGEGWTLEKVAIEEDYEWGAVFKAGEKELYRFGEGISKEDVCYLLWPSPKSARFLCVYRRGGGQAGPYALDVIDLEDSFRSVLTTGSYNQFTAGVADLDGDGLPEFIGRSLGFSCAPTMRWSICSAEEPRPLAVMSYDPATKCFRSAAFLFASYALKDREKREEDFVKQLGAQGKLLPSSLIDKEYQPGLLVNLLQWSLELIYCGKEQEAWCAFDKYCEPPLAKAVKQAVQETLKEDEVYQDMLKYRKEKEKPLNK